MTITALHYHVASDPQTMTDDLEYDLNECVMEHGLDEYRERTRIWNHIAWSGLVDVNRPIIRGIKETMVWASE